MKLVIVDCKCNQNKFYTHHDGTKIAFVSPSYANQNGLNTSGDACNSKDAGC